VSREKRRVEEVDYDCYATASATCVMTMGSFISSADVLHRYKSKPRFDRKLLLIKRG
jgi:hypothetical protein